MRFIIGIIVSLLLATTSYSASLKIPGLIFNPILLNLPDLEVSEARLLSQNVRPDGSREYRLRVTVRNIGLRASGGFKLAADARGLNSSPIGYFTVPLHPTGAAFSWYTHTNELAAGQSRTLFLSALVSRHYNSNPTIRIHADSCAGEEFMPPHCRVVELNENNNMAVVR